MRRLGLLLLLMGITIATQAQGLSIGVGTGGGAGWWIYDRGLTDTLPQVHRGYDRTRFSFILPMEVWLRYSVKGWHLGAGLSYQILFDDHMVSTETTTLDNRNYLVAEPGSSVTYLQYFVWVALDLVRKERFSMGPSLRLGSFSIDNRHPDKAYFSDKWYFDAGVQFLIHLDDRWVLTMLPRYTAMHIGTSGSPYPDQKSKILYLGILAGIEFRIL